ncbi:hypothetical protein D3C78_1913380 [compost metagenome]
MRAIGGVARLLGRRVVGAHQRGGVGALNSLLVGFVRGLWRDADGRRRLGGVDGAVRRLRKCSRGNQCQCRAAQ